MEKLNKSILLALLVVCLASCTEKRGKDCDIYLPKGFSKNYIIIFYNQKDGVPKEINKVGKRVYRIPTSGVLFSQFEQQLDVSFKEEVYFLDKNNRLTLIKDYYYSKYHGEGTDENKVYTFSGFFSDKEGFGYSCDFRFVGKVDEIIEKDGLIKPLANTQHIVDSIVHARGWVETQQ
ncbi:hypothetical protein KSK37_13320 [Kaistella sp. DKR-2]|uniref:DUF6843 domain-containing protein n=1 Tax=Kaistella soli TaxID=2849654 RepID=UPI001C25229D|nr:hypothetical protein [Kaistella soli]MBU8884068.1 hypothetical protein [Kaistella soli]